MAAAEKRVLIIFICDNYFYDGWINFIDFSLFIALGEPVFLFFFFKAKLCM